MASSSSSLSGPVKALTDNALDFLKKNAIVLAPVGFAPDSEYHLDDGATFRSGTAGVKLVQTPTATVYWLQFVPSKDLKTDKEAMEAFVLGSKQNKGNHDVPFLDLPRKNALEGTFLFTVGLTGCSVIVTRWDDHFYRVFHDRRVDSAVLYDNVEYCVNYNDYRIGGRYLSGSGSAITCMQFKRGGWKMFLQRQLPPLDTTVVPQKWEVHAHEVQKIKNPESLERAFNDRRTNVIQKRLTSNAKNLKVDKTLIDGAQDGVVRGVEYDKGAIRGWEALRNAIQRQIRSDRDKGIAPSHTYDRFEDDLRESEDIDETWIWLQVKKNKIKLSTR